MVTSPEFIGPLRKKYLSHLTYLIMVDSRTLIPERLGGADFDGDMIRTVADPLLNSCVLRNHDSREFDPFGFGSGIPLLKIPAAEPQIRDANDLHARFEVIKGTFSSRIGQICNAAFDRSVIAYDENAKDGWKDRLDPRMVEVIKNLIADYEQAKHRIRSSRVQRPEMTRKNDVERILFSRGQEKTYSADELYSLYSTKSPEEISEMCTALREHKWHIMLPDKRHDFLLEHFYSFSADEYFCLFSDFRHGGYRILWDIVCDYDDMYRSQTAKKNHFSRKGDSPELKTLLQLYGIRHKPDYKEDLAIIVRNILREKGIGTEDALKCAIALGERSFAYEVLLTEVERQAATTEKKRWWKRS